VERKGEGDHDIKAAGSNGRKTIEKWKNRLEGRGEGGKGGKREKMNHLPIKAFLERKNQGRKEGLDNEGTEHRRDTKNE